MRTIIKIDNAQGQATKLDQSEDSLQSIAEESGSFTGVLGKRSSNETTSIDKLREAVNDDSDSDEDDQFGVDGDKRERR